MAECMSPFELKNTNTGVLVPCGKCPYCRSKRASAWGFRLMQEDKISLSSSFVTLTYNTDHVPITENGFMSLRKSDLQDFFKRLRKKTPNRIRYYAVGEYGGRGWRPHYHVILFNGNPDIVINAWCLDNKPLGDVHFGTVAEASVGYTLKYITKEPRIPQHARDDRVKEFSLMSKGLGLNYLTPTMIKYHTAGSQHSITTRMHCTLADGKKIGMPRYYKDKLYTKEQRTTAGVVLLKEAQERAELKLKEAIRIYGSWEAAEHARIQRDLLKQTKMREHEQRSKF